jgi:hypothetical protein
MVDTSGLVHVLKVDANEKTALVEPNVPVNSLVDATRSDEVSGHHGWFFLAPFLLCQPIPRAMRHDELPKQVSQLQNHVQILLKEVKLTLRS